MASLGRHGSSAIANDRRFFHPPDVVQVSDGAQTFLAVAIASGNRAAPLKTTTTNWLYVLMDKDNQTLPIQPADLKDFSSVCTGGNCPSLLDPNLGLDPDAKIWKGWKAKLATAPGEKALSSPVTLNGDLVFTSYVPPNPSAATCTPQQGVGRLYAVDLATGAAGAGRSQRSTAISPPGIAATAQYVGTNTFIVSKDILLEINSQLIWPTWWRKRNAAP
ncbi:MAG: hypothetical protein L0H19_09080 [Salinisphaera sp.]|nr:hypothetical protein [Salinisphaera sp.]